jgi:hypothetical protein
MLTPEDRTLLDFERCWINMVGPKDWNIENILGLSAETYYVRLRDLASDPDARVYDRLTTLRVAALIEDSGHVEAAV